MAQTTATMKPVEVAKIFESVFMDKMCVSPAEIGLNKNVLTEVGMDSLDSLDVIMELEKKFKVKIPDKESSLLAGSSIYEFLEAFLRSLIIDKRLKIADASIVRTQYAKLLKPTKNAIVSQYTDKYMGSVPKSLLDEYEKSVAHTKELAKKIAQYQK